MIDGVPGCLPSKKSRPKLRPGLSRDRVSAKVEGKLTQNPEYAAGAIFLALTVTQSASQPACQRRRFGAFDWRVSSTFRIEMSFWLGIEFFIANCCQKRQRRGLAERACQELPYFSRAQHKCHINLMSSVA